MKGQTTIVNLIMILVALFLYFAFIPVISPMIESTADYLEMNTTNEFADITIVLLYMIPFILLLVILLTAFHYAVPRREGQ